VGLAEFRGRAGEDVEDDEFLFAQVFADVAFLFFVQAAAEVQEFLEDPFDVAACSTSWSLE
jgi:hypothetical protein